MFRISQNAQESVVDMDHVEQLEPKIRIGAADRYHIDVISSCPLPPDHPSARWGVVVKHSDGSLDLKRKDTHCKRKDTHCNAPFRCGGSSEKTRTAMPPSVAADPAEWI
jgi:hypothetical protein